MEYKWNLSGIKMGLDSGSIPEWAPDTYSKLILVKYSGIMLKSGTTEFEKVCKRLKLLRKVCKLFSNYPVKSEKTYK